MLFTPVISLLFFFIQITFTAVNTVTYHFRKGFTGVNTQYSVIQYLLCSKVFEEKRK